MALHVRVPDPLRSALPAAGVADPAGGLVFAARNGLDGWEAVRAELEEAFTLTAAAVRDGHPIVYVVHHDDLLGRRGPEGAMVATALLSGARTVGAETAKAGIPANVLAVTDATSPATAAAWIVHLLGQGADGATGEVVRLGPDHIGKALP